MKIKLVIFILFLGCLYCWSDTSFNFVLNKNINSMYFGDTINNNEIIVPSINCFASIYGDNYLELNVGYFQQNYFNEKLNSFDKRHGFYIEIGKIISEWFFVKDKKLFTPSVSAGFNFTLFPFNNDLSEQLNRQIAYFIGFYGSAKIRLNYFAEKLNLKSFDIGYKVVYHLTKDIYQSNSIAQYIFVGVTF